MAHAASTTTTGNRPEIYYVPEGSNWPWIGMVSLAVLMVGAGLWLNEISVGEYIFYGGVAMIIMMMVGWFSAVVSESKSNKYSPQMDRTFSYSMAWFIFSEVMFFAAFFGAYYYFRIISQPCAMGEGGSECLSTNLALGGTYEGTWREVGNGPANLGASIETGKLVSVAAMGSFAHGFKEWFWESLPLVNTIILLTSGLTLTWAHHAIFTRKNSQVILGLALTVALGVIFLTLQAIEYMHAWELGLTLGSGGYGSVFYLTTGFHGLHVFMGTVMLTVQLGLALRKYHTPERHFGFEAAAWYWHFVDVVWLGLFIFLYIL